MTDRSCGVARINSGTTPETYTPDSYTYAVRIYVDRTDPRPGTGPTLLCQQFARAFTRALQQPGFEANVAAQAAVARTGADSAWAVYVAGGARVTTVP